MQKPSHTTSDTQLRKTITPTKTNCKRNHQPHQKTKNSHGSHPGSMTSPLSPFPPEIEEIVDLTMIQSQSPP
jgi:hypothetical protein